MYKTILVPLDGSAVSEAALPYAGALATRTGASLALVRAVGGKPGDRDQRRAITQAEVYLAAIADKLAAAGLRVQIGVPYGGSPSAWIIEEITLRQADLVVMATHARSGPDHLLHGSIAEAVVARAPTPVLVMRAEGPHGPQQFDAAEPTFVVPLDGSELAESALPVAQELATALGGRIVLVGVVPRPGALLAGEGAVITYTDRELARFEEDACAYLSQSAQQCGRNTETAVRIGEPAAEIAALADETAAAAIIMATRGRTGLTRGVLGSVAGQVVRRSSAPVMLIRPPRLRAAELPVTPIASALPA